jgi:peptide/nickel transport system permease protein
MMRSPLVALAGLVQAIILAAALLAPWLAPHDPGLLDPLLRLKPASTAFPLGNDVYGRDLLSRVLFGARISLGVGIGTALCSVVLGLAIGLSSSFLKRLDAVVMRIVDGVMAMPNVLLAITIVTLFGSSLTTVVCAITIPEIPRVVRLVRSVVLTVREEPYVEAAVSLGSSLPRILWRHLMPNTFAPLIVQGSFVCASAILTEAVLSFLGTGINPVIPSWGNIMAEGRAYFRLRSELIFWPGLCLSFTILSINILGDALRDRLDPRLAKRGAAR